MNTQGCKTQFYINENGNFGDTHRSMQDFLLTNGYLCQQNVIPIYSLRPNRDDEDSLLHFL